MEKSFFDVFPGLKLKTELQALLEDVIVTKVSCNAGKTQLRVYIKSSRWIHKKHIFELEEQDPETVLPRDCHGCYFDRTVLFVRAVHS